MKKKSKNIRAAKLLEASNEGNIDLLNEMKKVRGSKKGTQSLPECVDGAQGHQEILDKFREVYETLYNSAESKESMDNIKRLLKDLINENSMDEVIKVTGAKVKEACTKTVSYTHLTLPTKRIV